MAKKTGSSTLLVYACLEARNAIEQLWFEILMLLKGGEMTREFFEKSQSRTEGFAAAIKEIEPRYRELTQFVKLICECDPNAPFRVIVWDLRILNRLQNKLSKYCHAQGHPIPTIEEESWVERGHQLVVEAHGYITKELESGTTAMMSLEDMSPAGLSIWHDFSQKKINEEQVRIRLRIVRPAH